MIQDGSWLLPINCIQTCKEKTNKYKGDFKPICSSHDTIHICTLGYNWMWNWDLVLVQNTHMSGIVGLLGETKTIKPHKKMCIFVWRDSFFVYSNFTIINAWESTEEDFNWKGHICLYIQVFWSGSLNCWGGCWQTCGCSVIIYTYLRCRTIWLSISLSNGANIILYIKSSFHYYFIKRFFFKP